MPELDSIRGLAILGVLVYHAFYIQGSTMAQPGWQHLLIVATWPGRLGVNLFFVLSGFLITGILLEAREKESYYKRFYVRRALRILPIYIAILIILAIAGYPLSFVVLSFFYLANFAHLFGITFAYVVIWSLAVEEHFYLIWPLLVRNLSRINLERVTIAIIVLSPLVRLVSYRYAAPHDLNWLFYTWNNADGLACGAFLALFIRRTKSDRRMLRLASLVACALAAGLWVFGWPFGIMDRLERPLGAALQIVPFQFLFFGVLGAFLLIGTTTWKWLVLWRPLRFLGYISYGLYLTHLLVFNVYDRVFARLHLLTAAQNPMPALIIRFVAGGSAAILLAWLSRKYFEDPFLRMKPKT
ncbi:MAG TPA: acyltransferase [Candidatus Acidoferrum sp.]|nr:acyltransferase [Candidatus Acidoferrum sp.]